ncbi:MAG: penicillin-binding protein 1A [Betaproteobacteria bacterium]|jgi:penicillin-binding protein 1A
MLLRWWFVPFFVVMSLVVAAALLVGYAAVVAYPALPSLDALTDYRPKIPLQIFSTEGDLIGEFGEERRAVVTISEVPERMIRAIIAAEDERFYEHGGVDYIGIARAALSNFVHGSARQGASTITMQVARNFFLTKEKTFIRKFNEALLAFKIEHSLSKDSILQLYINQIFLGQRAYGFASAAQTYFGKPLGKLTLAEQAMLAGLPKAPSSYNPIVNPTRAKTRQEYVLRRMKALGYIDDAAFESAVAAPIEVKRDRQAYATRADYLTEMVRQELFERFKEDAYTTGLRVQTTLSREHQDAAVSAVWRGVFDYDRRHGYRGAESYVDFTPDASDEALEELFGDDVETNGIFPALVMQVDTNGMQLFARGVGRTKISGDGLKFAQRMIGDRAPPERRLRRGALTRIARDDSGRWQIVQLPGVEAALVGVEASTGAIRALVGGVDFGRNQFNHVTQAYRQPGSSFKPFIYSAALEKGFTPSTIINDAPLSFDASETGSTSWEPKNFDGDFDGPISMRTALTKSKNMVSIRILQAITPQYAQDYAIRFGFERRMIPAYLTMALGAGSVTPLQMAVGYSVFANGGFRVTPYFIDRISDAKGKVIDTSKPQRAGESAPRAIDARNAFIMTSMMQDVIKGGTAARAMRLGRSDLAGKTGTTNEQRDAWFAGFNPRLVAIAWMGFDTPRPLGASETGASAALPMWMNYMAEALKRSADEPPSPPEGVMATLVNPETGLRDERSPGSKLEYFLQENIPLEEPAASSGAVKRKPRSEDLDDQLY